MKYGLLIDFGSSFCNFGDYVQSVAIEQLYSQMGIPESEIVHITAKELASYDGEQLLLPYNYVLHFLVNPKDGSANISKKITPVFIGASVEFATLFNSYPLENFAKPEKKWLTLLQKFAPIGCRDDFTRQFIEKLGIPTYLQGCITNILPRRPEGDYQKILIVDCPAEVLPHIPEEFLDRVEVIHNAENIDDLTVEENYCKIKRRYEYYRDNAAMVVTSRYHVATPCNAMGIPSVFVCRPLDKHVKDIRMDTLNPGIQLCRSDNYDGIDWKPQWHDFEELKSNIVQMAAARIRETYERQTQAESIYRFFQPRINEYENSQVEEAVFETRLRKYVQQHYAAVEGGRFYVWGAIQLLCDGDRVVLSDIVHEVNPKLEFVGWIDTFKSGEMANRPIAAPDAFDLRENDFIIVAAETAVHDALKRFEAMNLKEHQFLILSNTMIEENDLFREKARRLRNTL